LLVRCRGDGRIHQHGLLLVPGVVDPETAPAARSIKVEAVSVVSAFASISRPPSAIGSSGRERHRNLVFLQIVLTTAAFPYRSAGRSRRHPGESLVAIALTDIEDAGEERCDRAAPRTDQRADRQPGR